MDETEAVPAGSGGTALVTGASGGIGSTLCRELVSRDIRVLAVDVDWNGEALDDLPHGSIHATADVTKVEEISDAIALLGDGRLDYAFLNAGLVSPNHPLLSLDEDDVRNVIDVNVVGTIFSLAETARKMVNQAAGSILLVASVQALIGRPTYAVYGSSKAAVAALARHSAVELAPHGVRVNAIAPGGVMTPKQRSSFDDPTSGRSVDQELSMVPMKRFADTQEMASAMVDICTRFSFATGSTFVVDGGESVP